VNFEHTDAYGVYGDILRFCFLFALLAGALAIFFQLWKNGRLDMDEEAKKTMMETDDHAPI